jgi:glucose/arabinose dehydrogenase
MSRLKQIALGIALVIVALGVTLAIPGDRAKLPLTATEGPDPSIPQPDGSLVPTVKVAEAKGWNEGEKPVAASGLAVDAFATGLDHPRWLYTLPNGDVLVAETNAPERPQEGKGIKGAIMKVMMGRAGGSVPSPNRIILLRDSDGDGKADQRSVFLNGLNSPFGMALIGDKFYVANTDAVMRFAYTEGATEIATQGEKVADLPGGPLNHHWTKSLVASSDGSYLYVGVGSNSNVAENGLDQEKGRAAIYEIDAANGKSRIFASGLRNPVGLALEPESGLLWAVVNERDELGSDLVPDYLTSVKDGAFFGWPFSYWGQHVDQRVRRQDPDLVAKAIPPDYALGNHVAPLGLAFTESEAMPAQFRNGAFIGEHGSWNRDPFNGYRVVFVPFAGGKPSGQPLDVLTGFLNKDGEARGRPVGIALAKDGAVLVADDVGNVVWRVTKGPQSTAMRP